MRQVLPTGLFGGKSFLKLQERARIIVHGATLHLGGVAVKGIPRSFQPVLVETFVDRARFAGTCYAAANWQCVGQTQGRGKRGDNPLSVKAVWVYPLVPNFRTVLTGGRLTAPRRSAP